MVPNKESSSIVCELCHENVRDGEVKKIYGHKFSFVCADCDTDGAGPYKQKRLF